MNEPNIIIDETLAPESRRCELSIGHGCEFCHNEGEELCAKAKEGCYKLHETDWLAEYPNNGPTDIVEVRFKNTHRSYYANVNNLPLEVGDIVAVEASPGHDIGIVSLTGDMVARQMRRVGFNPQNGEFRKIYRKARSYDIEKWHEAVAREHEVMIRSRQIAADMGLDMKIGDVEFQGDGIKAIFYYIADERVDFRELIKVFADQFRIRIEMKQIGARQEAGRIGGLGACGRQLCCASWISSFNSVTTNAARTQDLSLNPQKLAGQCSKLKCCLTYELDDYIDARKEFPRLNGPLQALDADYFHIKNDILARTMSFSTQPGSMAGLISLSIGRVREIMRLNAEGKKPEKITSDTVVDTSGEEPTYINVIGEDSITRFDKAKRNKKRKNKKGDNAQKNDQPKEVITAKDEESRNEKNKAEKPQNEKTKAEKPQNNKPKGDTQQNNKPQGERSQNGKKNKNEAAQNEKPQGKKNQGGKSQGEVAQGNKSHTEKPQGEVQQGEKPQGERGRGGNRGGRNNRGRNNRAPREGGQQQGGGQQGGKPQE